MVKRRDFVKGAGAVAKARRPPGIDADQAPRGADVLTEVGSDGAEE